MTTASTRVEIRPPRVPRAVGRGRSSACRAWARSSRPAAAAQRGVHASRAAARKPGEPGDAAAVRRQPDDRVGPRARERDASHLQLERLPLTQDQEGFAQGVRRQGRGDVLHDHGRGGREDRVRGGRLRRLLPDAGPHRPTRPRQGAAAAQPRLPPEPRRTSGRRSRTRWYDKGSQLHRPVHDVDDRDRVPRRQGREDAARLLEPVRDLLGRGQPREDVPARRQPRRARAHAPEERDHGHQHRGPRPDRAREERAQVADRRRQHQALDGRLHERPRGQGVGAPDVVGQRDLAPSGTCPEGTGRTRSASGSRRTAAGRSGTT